MLELLETHVYVLHEQKVSNNRADSSQRGHYVRPRVINSPSREGRRQLSPAKKSARSSDYEHFVVGLGREVGLGGAVHGQGQARSVL